MIEYLVGSENHTRNWGRFHVRGFDEIQLRADHQCNRRDMRHNRQFYQADAKPGAIFTILDQNGSNGHTDGMKFYICKVIEGQENTIKAGYGDGFITGNFEVIATGQTITKARRLLEWWIGKPTGVKREYYARHCAQYIIKRGVAVLPPLPRTEST